MGVDATVTRNWFPALAYYSAKQKACTNQVMPLKLLLLPESLTLGISTAHCGDQCSAYKLTCLQEESAHLLLALGCCSRKYTKLSARQYLFPLPFSTPVQWARFFLLPSECVHFPSLDNYLKYDTKQAIS